MSELEIMMTQGSAVQRMDTAIHQASVFKRVDNAIQIMGKCYPTNDAIHWKAIYPVGSVTYPSNNWGQMNNFPVDKCWQNKLHYPLDSDLFSKKHHPSFRQLGQVLQ